MPMTNSKPRWSDRLESALVLFGPFAIGGATACYGAIGKGLAAGSALGTGWALWQLSMIVVLSWKAATTKEDVGRPRRRPRARR
jgi:hypothetical protein